MGKKDQNEEVNNQEEVVEGETQETSEEIEVEGEVKDVEMSEEEESWYLKFVRLSADFENFRKRSQKEKIDIINTASSTTIKALLPVLDDFDRAIKSNEETENIAVLKEGFSIIQNKLLSTLKSKGLEPMDAKGKVFDTEFHEAVTNFPVENKKDKGKVFDVAEKGYLLNETVLRYAKVIVGQ